MTISSFFDITSRNQEHRTVGFTSSFMTPCGTCICCELMTCNKANTSCHNRSCHSRWRKVSCRECGRTKCIHESINIMRKIWEASQSSKKKLLEQGFIWQKIAHDSPTAHLRCFTKMNKQWQQGLLRSLVYANKWHLGDSAVAQVGARLAQEWAKGKTPRGSAALMATQSMYNIYFKYAILPCID